MVCASIGVRTRKRRDGWSICGRDPAPGGGVAVYLLTDALRCRDPARADQGFLPDGIYGQPGALSVTICALAHGAQLSGA